MTSQLIEADERLSAVFSHFYCVQLPDDALPMAQQLMPNYEMMLVFNFGPDIPISLGEHQHHVKQTAVIGPLQTMLAYTLPPGADAIVMNFTLNGFYRLMGVSMQQFHLGEMYDPDVLLNNHTFHDLWRRLAGMRSVSDRIPIINDYVLTFVSPSSIAEKTLVETVDYFAKGVADPVKAVAQTQQLSPRSVQLQFQTYLGYSAKELSRFLRFKKVLHFLYQQRPQSVDWPNLVVSYGYYDQSHLIKDFNYFLGTTPRQFIKQLARGKVCISKSGKFY